MFYLILVAFAFAAGLILWLGSLCDERNNPQQRTRDYEGAWSHDAGGER